MATAPPLRSPLEGEDGHGEEQVPETNNNNNLIIPDDGFEWKKYGQKFIRKIRKNRSYFKCHKKKCKAKKRAEWPPTDTSNLRIVYVGDHDHPLPQPRSNSEQEASSSIANQYDLVTQVFGPPIEPS